MWQNEEALWGGAVRTALCVVTPRLCRPSLTPSPSGGRAESLFWAVGCTRTGITQPGVLASASPLTSCVTLASASLGLLSHLENGHIHSIGLRTRPTVLSETPLQVLRLLRVQSQAIVDKWPLLLVLLVLLEVLLGFWLHFPLVHPPKPTGGPCFLDILWPLGSCEQCWPVSCVSLPGRAFLCYVEMPELSP